MNEEPRNETRREDIVLKEGADYNFVTTVKDKTSEPSLVIDISGYTFTANLLDKDGGSILATITVTLLTDGTDGKYKEVFTSAEIDALVASGNIPRWWEFYATSGGVTTKWLSGRVSFEPGGS